MLKEIYSAGILGIGVNIPDEVRKNDFWDNIPLVNLTRKERDPFKGIDERRAFSDELLPSDIEVVAARRALEDSGINPDAIDLVMVHSMVQDELIPGNASLVQYKLGLKNAGAWNMDTCCSSFVTMAIAASNLIAMGTFKNIIIVTSILHSHILDYSHYISPSLGDGAAAVVMGRVSEGRGYIVSHCGSNGAYHDAFTLKEKIPEGSKWVHYKSSPAKPVLVFNDETAYKIGKNSLKDMTDAISAVLNKGNVKPEDIDFFVSHQPVHWAHEAWRDAFGISPAKSYQTFRKYGNIASSTIPINLFEARMKDMLYDDGIVLMASSGAGENFSVALFRWGR
ncbi:MAG: 3-oxoacyl-ACP synthase III family protein [Ruminiclostridium sp.]